MNADGWDRVRELFLAAVDMPRNDRERLFDECCGDAPGIRRDVEALLACDADADERLRGIVASAALQVRRAQISEAVGRRIGPYLIERELGSGGMGAVYLAVRDDEQFRQRVAIKVVNRGMDSEFAVTQFRKERQVLADLHHPNIAQLLDGGATAEGLPFFAMEYLEGLPLTTYCDTQKLGTAARLDLFFQVCAAVRYAHKNLVIHGDLKPGNILVSNGIPKLLDFGIATLIGAHSQQHTVSISPVTKQYASPEQLAGLPLSTSTDVYSLGAVLRELVGRDIADLDAIAGKALEEDPGARYASVDELTADLRAYVEFRPVAARRGGWRYRARKLARRRRVALAATAAVAASLVAGAGIAWMQAREAKVARQRAEDRLTEMVTMSNQSVTEILGLMERLPGAVPARRALLESTLGPLENLSRDAGGNIPLRIALAKAYHRLGDLEGGPEPPNLGDRETAVKRYATAAGLMESISPRSAAGVEGMLLWMEAERKIGAVLDLRGAPARGEEALHRELAFAGTLSRADRDRKEIRHEVAAAYLILSRTQMHTNPSLAGDYAVRAAREMEELARRFPGDSEMQYEFSRAEIQAGYVSLVQGEPEITAVHYERAMRLRERLVAEHPHDVIYRRSLMLSYQHYAAVLGSPLVANTGRTEEARAYYRKALAVAQSAQGGLNDITSDAEFGGLLVRANALDVPGSQAAESLDALRRGSALLETAVQKEGEGSQYSSINGKAHEFMGKRLLELGRIGEAIAEYRRATALANRILGHLPGDRDGKANRFDSTSGLAMALAAAHNPASLAQANALFGMAADEQQTARAYLCLAKVQNAMHMQAAAAANAREARRRAVPLATGRAWDPAAAVARDAEALLAAIAPGL
ncbi:MAG TPA: serine/threonine-protein kinase [Candidatus Limnocylindrales bacterium]|nr:serine/threonine-protein kinase [Candidatus Limnocylindrales bacterium]